MGHIIRTLIIACATAGTVAISLTAPSQARVRHYGYGPHVHVSPYAYRGYAYVPSYRYWQPPLQYDTSGMAFSTRDLGWQGGPPTGAPSNPCYIGQRMQNRC